MSYRGWTNYETWAINNWYGPYISECGATDKLSANDIKDLVEPHATVGLKSSLVSDLVRTSLHRVNWEELADAYQPEPILYDEF